MREQVGAWDHRWGRGQGQHQGHPSQGDTQWKGTPPCVPWSPALAQWDPCPAPPPVCLPLPPPTQAPGFRWVNNYPLLSG